MAVATSDDLARASLALDHELVERIQQGEKQAFRQLYDRYARLVYRYILLRVRNPQDAEDLTSETFTKAWRALASFEWRDTSPGAWLLRIAHNLIVDQSRRHRDVLGFLPWHHGKEQVEFEQIQDRDEIQRAFDALSTEQQMIVYLHYFEGYDLAEVARFLNKTPNAVTVAQFRALQRMQKVLKHA